MSVQFERDELSRDKTRRLRERTTSRSSRERKHLQGWPLEEIVTHLASPTHTNNDHLLSLSLPILPDPNNPPPILLPSLPSLPPHNQIPPRPPHDIPFPVRPFLTDLAFERRFDGPLRGAGEGGDDVGFYFGDGPAGDEEEGVAVCEGCLTGLEGGWRGEVGNEERERELEREGRGGTEGDGGKEGRGEGKRTRREGELVGLGRWFGWLAFLSIEERIDQEISDAATTKEKRTQSTKR